MLNLKKDFLLNPDFVFLNHGSFGAVPKPVFENYQRWQRELERQPVEFLGRQFNTLMHHARTALAEYLHTNANDLVFVTNASVAINIVAHSLDLHPGDIVLATDHEYGAMDRTWRFLAGKKGFSYINQPIRLPITSPGEVIDQLFEGVTENTRVLFISHYTSPTALIFPIAEICRRARQRGILTVIDGAHAPGQINLNLTELEADFYVGNLHKWLCAPKGSGFLFARPEVQDLIQPLVISWGWQAEQPGASPFVDCLEWTGTRDISPYLTVPAAIRYQEDHHWDEVRNVCHEFASETRQRISAITKLPNLHPDHSDWYIQMGAVALPDRVDILGLKKGLYETYKIEIPLIRWNNLILIRFSLQAYNSREDIIKLENALKVLL